MPPFLRRSFIVALALCVVAVGVAGYAREKSGHAEVVGWADGIRADGTFGGMDRIEAQVPRLANQLAWESAWLVTLVFGIAALITSPRLAPARLYMLRAALIAAGVEAVIGVALLLHGYGKAGLAMRIARASWPLAMPFTPIARLVGLNVTAVVAPMLAGVVYGTVAGSVWGIARRQAYQASWDAPRPNDR